MDSVQDNSSVELDIALPAELQKLSTLLDNCPETLAAGNAEIHAAALTATKYIFDLSVCSEQLSRPHVVDFISLLAPYQAPQTRSKAKVESEQPQDNLKTGLFNFTPLESLFIDEMDDEQIWAQLDLRTQTICHMLECVLEGEIESSNQGEETDSSEDDDANLRETINGLKEEGVDMEELMAKYGLDKDDLDSDSTQDESEKSSTSGTDGEIDEEAEKLSPLRDVSSEETDSDKLHLSPRRTSKKRKREGSSELDDGFFDLAEFNAYTERAEAKSSTKGRLAGDDSDVDEEEIDLFANVDTVDSDDDGNDGRDVFYGDFFEAPSRTTHQRSSRKSESNNNSQVRFHENVRVKKIKATGKNRSLRDDDLDDLDEYMFEDEGISDGESDFDDDEVQDFNGQNSEQEELEEGYESGVVDDDVVQRLRHDLFAEEEEENIDDMTTYEKRVASLQDQIAELESENVAPKEWMLTGETGSRQRPQNSLLEEDLEFDRVRKAVPVITEEVVQSLEERIKARVLEGRFDDVVRIRPLEDKPFLPSKLLELQDTKSTQSLAQIYESEYLANQTGGSLPDDRDGRLKKEHDEITILWEKICSKLDALSNAHFVPKQPKASILTVTNAPTVLMESALPTSKSASSMLAPEEVFSSSPSALRARSELTPTEKRILRTKERKLKKRQRDVLDKSVGKFSKVKGMGAVKKQKQAALDGLVKHGKGVTIVGKDSVSLRKHKNRST